jgi:tetratricopeptide (TPR) repeat protein
MVFMNCFFYVNLFIIALPIHAIFEHDRAVSAYQAGNYTLSSDYMKKVVTRTPNDPVSLYDSGVVAYKNNDFDQAYAYFTTSLQQAAHDADVREKNHFNRAKVHEKRQEYKEAIADYKSVLQINPDNYKAKEEKIRLEKLLEDKKKEQKEKQSSQDQQKQDQEQPSDDNKKQDEQQQSDASARKQQAKHNRSEKSDEQQTSSENTQKQNAQKEPFGNEPKSETKREQTTQKQFEHTKSMEEKELSNKKSITKNKAHEQSQPDDTTHAMPSSQKMDIMLERILAEQEKNDARLHKKFIKATIRQNMADPHGQQCW